MIINKNPKKVIPNVFNPVRKFGNSNHFQDNQFYYNFFIFVIFWGFSDCKKFKWWSGTALSPRTN